MKAPQELRTAADGDEALAITRRDYDDGSLVAIDLGTAEAALDVLGGTAIVVAGDRQFEFAVPSGATDLRTNNGLLLIEG